MSSEPGKITSASAEALFSRLNELLREELDLDAAAITGLSSEPNPWKLCVQCHATVETAATSLLLERNEVMEGSEQGKALARLPYRAKVTLAFGGRGGTEPQHAEALLPGLLALGAARNRRAHNIRNFQLPFEEQELRPMMAALSKWSGLDVQSALRVRDLQGQGRVVISGLAVIAAMVAVTDKSALEMARTTRMSLEAIRRASEEPER